MYELHQVLLVAIMVVIVYTAAGVLCGCLKIKERREKEGNQLLFFNSIKQGITYGWVGNLEDIKKIYSGMEGKHDGLEVLVRRFVFHYLVNFQRPLEKQMTTEIKNTIDRILRQLELVGRRDILLGEDRIVLDGLGKAIDSGKRSEVQDRLMDLAQLLGEKNQRIVAPPARSGQSHGFLIFGTASVISLICILMAAVLGKFLA